MLNYLHLSLFDAIWLTIGFTGQLLFSLRFIVQWIYSEKSKKSIIPVAFWYFSLSGGIVLLTYAIHKRDPVFICGQLFGVLIYIRNLWFIHREQQTEASIKT